MSVREVRVRVSLESRLGNRKYHARLVSQEMLSKILTVIELIDIVLITLSVV